MLDLTRRRLLATATGLLVAGLLPVAAATRTAASTTFQFLSPSEAAAGAKSGKWKILDVRPVPPLDYISGHLPNAVHLSEQAFRGPNGNLPYQIWGQTDLANLLRRLWKTSAIRGRMAL